MKATLDDAIARFYADSSIVKLARERGVSEEILHALFSNGFSMGALHGFTEAQMTLETTLLEHARGKTH